jgi:hypothetical protein
MEMGILSKMFFAEFKFLVRPILGRVMGMGFLNSNENILRV